MTSLAPSFIPSRLGSMPAADLVTLSKGGASVYADRTAPSGYRWDFVTLRGERVTLNGEPVVALVKAA